MVAQGNSFAWEAARFDELFDFFEKDEEEVKRRKGYKKDLDKSKFSKLVNKIDRNFLMFRVCLTFGWCPSSYRQ